MQRLNKNPTDSYNLDNCFGFNESGVNLSLWERSSVVNDTDALLEFQPNKPYRLALYVRRSEQKRLERTKTNILVQNTIEKQKINKKKERFNNTPLIVKKEIKGNTRKKEKVSIMLFDEKVKPENVSKKIQMTSEKDKSSKNIVREGSSTKENVLKEINTKSLTRTKQSKVRRSYERKFKEKEETENIPEPPSEQILKELEFKKLSRTKQKKTVKEEQEFEKWAKNMNSAFNDVDKFELSIAYD